MQCVPCTERWMQPGTEYAITSKLPLSQDWYEGLGMDMGNDCKGEDLSEGTQYPRGVASTFLVLVTDCGARLP